MKKHILTRLIISVLTVISLLVASVGVCAVSGESYTLTVEFVTDESPIAGSEVRVYRALDSNGVLIGEFAGCDVEIGDLYDSEELGRLADTLYSFVLRDKITAELSEATNLFGTASFNIPEEGVYLISGTPVNVDGVLYTPKPALVRIPYVSELGELVTDVVAEFKYDRRVITEDTVERSVIKVWDDDDAPLRPTEITVQLLRNGDIFETVTLTAQTDWQYSWTGLDPGFDWQIAEADVPEGYNVSITLDDTTFIVTNTLDEPPPKVTTTAPATTTSGKATVTTTAPRETTLPQTGQLWWPVPVIFIAGLLLFLAGIIICNTNDDEKA